MSYLAIYSGELAVLPVPLVDTQAVKAMTKDIRHIHSYYSPNDLYNKIFDGLNILGKDLSKLTLDDLQPVDEFHIRGDTATRELIELAKFKPDMHILDVGCWMLDVVSATLHIDCFMKRINEG